MDLAGPWLSGRGTLRLQFWCVEADREVEVEFDRRQPGGALVGVRGCSVFGTGRDVACAHACLEAARRRRWEPGLLPAALRDYGGG